MQNQTHFVVETFRGRSNSKWKSFETKKSYRVQIPQKVWSVKTHATLVSNFVKTIVPDKTRIVEGDNKRKPREREGDLQNKNNRNKTGGKEVDQHNKSTRRYKGKGNDINRDNKQQQKGNSQEYHNGEKGKCSSTLSGRQLRGLYEHISYWRGAKRCIEETLGDMEE